MVVPPLQAGARVVASCGTSPVTYLYSGLIAPIKTSSTGAAAAWLPESHKRTNFNLKYTELSIAHTFTPVAIET